MLHLFQLSKSLPHTHSLADKAYVVDAPPPFTHTQVGARLSSHVCPQWGYCAHSGASGRAGCAGC
jgi:hypothetical protein